MLKLKLDFGFLGVVEMILGCGWRIGFGKLKRRLWDELRL